MRIILLMLVAMFFVAATPQPEPSLDVCMAWAGGVKELTDMAGNKTTLPKHGQKWWCNHCDARVEEWCATCEEKAKKEYEETHNPYAAVGCAAAHASPVCIRILSCFEVPNLGNILPPHFPF